MKPTKRAQTGPGSSSPGKPGPVLSETLVVVPSVIEAATVMTLVKESREDVVTLVKANDNANSFLKPSQQRCLGPKWLFHVIQEKI